METPKKAPKNRTAVFWIARCTRIHYLPSQCLEYNSSTKLLLPHLCHVQRQELGPVQAVQALHDERHDNQA